MSALKMPERLIGDGPISVSRVNSDHVAIDVDGYHLECSDFNAWRLFGILSVMLEIPLPPRTSKAIKFG